MAENSKIEWTDHTFNAWYGCQKVSPACDHCYAEDWDRRFNKGEHWGPHAPRVRTSARNWGLPIKWNHAAMMSGTRMKVFVNSLGDVFDSHPSIKDDWQDDLWTVIGLTQYLDWQLLTKRPQNIKHLLPDDWGDGYPNVWLGTTAENQEEADRRIPHLLDVSAKVHFLSCEPLLGPVDLTCIPVYGVPLDALRGDGHASRGLGWIIAGGESGAKARPTHPDRFRSLRDQCVAANVPFFFKQWGEWAPVSGAEGDGSIWKFLDHATVRRVGKKAAGRTLDGVTWDQMPEVSQ